MNNAINSRVNREIKELINNTDCFCLESQEISKIENLQVFVQEDLSQIEIVESATFKGIGNFTYTNESGSFCRTYRFSGSVSIKNLHADKVKTPLKLYLY